MKLFLMIMVVGLCLGVAFVAPAQNVQPVTPGSMNLSVYQWQDQILQNQYPYVQPQQQQVRPQQYDAATINGYMMGYSTSNGRVRPYGSSVPHSGPEDFRVGQPRGDAN